MRVLLIDNYDSYTFNLWQLLASVHPGYHPVVIRNDQLTWDELAPRLHLFDYIVISPGPGRPEVPEDIGVCADVLRQAAAMPILGVCLGHQALAAVNGGRIEHAPEARHGRLSPVLHTDSTGLFEHIPSPFRVVRYHSLRIAPDATGPLDILAMAEDDGSIMAVKHRHRPHWGVQFHPESVCTEHGRQLIENFARLVSQGQSKPRATADDDAFAHVAQEWNIIRRRSLPKSIALREHEHPAEPPCTIRCEHFAFPGSESSRLFDALFGQAGVGTVYLDSAKVEHGLSRFSYMASWHGALGMRVEYSVSSRNLSVISQRTGQTWIESCADHPMGFLGWLRDRTEIFQPVHIPSSLPFDFVGGWVGYIAYELKDECADLERPPGQRHPVNDHLGPDGAIPTACFLMVDRIVVIDHESNTAYCITVDPNPTLYSQLATKWPQAAAAAAANADLDKIAMCNETWRAHVAHLVGQLASPDWSRNDVKATIDRKSFRAFLREEGPSYLTSREPMVPELPPKFVMALPREQYIEAVRESLEAIRDGESYEICLTTQIRTRTQHQIDAYRFYCRLRNDNPAPCAALLLLNDGLAIASSSPERFLKISANGYVESRPIKGTIRRGATPEEDERLRSTLASSEKDIAENLMIVDLLRNDLGKICETGSVCVPKFMAVETYASVHQLVSTVCGTLRPDVSAMDCVHKCFPPGSMTGAPKRRTMEIIDRLESHEPRGAYSGVLGFFSLNGAADLAVVIRTVTIAGQVISVGAGGAIIALSDALEEYEEMVLKASSVLPSVFNEIQQQQP